MLQALQESESDENTKNILKIFGVEENLKIKILEKFQKTQEEKPEEENFESSAFTVEEINKRKDMIEDYPEMQIFIDKVLSLHGDTPVDKVLENIADVRDYMTDLAVKNMRNPKNLHLPIVNIIKRSSKEQWNFWIGFLAP